MEEKNLPVIVPKKPKNVALKPSEAKIINIDLVASSTELGTVVVSAGKFEQKIEEVTISMSVMKPKMVENINTTSMDEAMEQVPGVTVIDGQANIRGGSGFSYGAGSRVLLLVDDLPMLAADASDVKWSFLPTENLEQIEVLKGASSALSNVLKLTIASAVFGPISGIFSSVLFFSLKIPSTLPQ